MKHLPKLLSLFMQTIEMIFCIAPITNFSNAFADCGLLASAISWNELYTKNSKERKMKRIYISKGCRNLVEISVTTRINNCFPQRRIIFVATVTNNCYYNLYWVLDFPRHGTTIHFFELIIKHIFILKA